jgi:hypothetical protein
VCGLIFISCLFFLLRNANGVNQRTCHCHPGMRKRRKPTHPSEPHQSPTPCPDGL